MMCACMHAKSLQSCPTLCNPMDCSPTGLLCPWDSPGKNTGVGCHFLLQGIFLTQGLNPGLLHCRQTLYHLSEQGSHDQHRQHIKKRRHYFANTSLSSQSYCLSSSHGLPWWLRSKESACNAGDLGSVPGLGRSPGGGHGNPLWYSCLENLHWPRSLERCSP